MARGIHRLAEGLPPVRRLRPGRECEAPAHGLLALEEVDEVVEPVDEQGLRALRFPLENPRLSLLDCRQVADELEEGAAGFGEEIGAVAAADDEAHVGLVLERLPGHPATAASRT